MKRKTLIFSLAFLAITALHLCAKTVDLTPVNRSMMNFNYSYNWSYSLSLLGFDITADVHRVKLQALLEKKVIDDLAFFKPEQKFLKLDLDFDKKAEIILDRRPTHFSIFNLPGNLCLFGLDYKNHGKPGGIHFLFDFKLRKEITLPDEKRFEWFGSDSGKTIAFRVSKPGVFYVLSDDLEQLKRVELEKPLFLRQVWELPAREYLVMHWPFNSGYHFSIVDGKGKIRQSFYADFQDGEFNLRSYLLDNFIKADFLDGRLYLSRVYPLTGQLELEEIDIKKGSRRVFKAEIEGFSSQHRNFRKDSINSLGEAVVAAVNGIFADSKGVSVSVSINEMGRKGEYFYNYLYLFSERGDFLGHLQIPFGPVLYYDRTNGEYIAHRKEDKSGEIKESLILIKIKGNVLKFL